MATISRRLDRLEQTSGAWSDIERLIEGRRFYDQLTDRQRRRYCQMIGVAQADFEAVNTLLFGDQHVTLAHIDPPTLEEVQQVKSEVVAGTFRNNYEVR